MKVKEGNFQNAKGRGGIQLFIDSKVQHSKRHNQPRQAMWRASKDERLHSK